MKTVVWIRGSRNCTIDAVRKLEGLGGIFDKAVLDPRDSFENYILFIHPVTKLIQFVHLNTPEGVALMCSGTEYENLAVEGVTRLSEPIELKEMTPVMVSDGESWYLRLYSHGKWCFKTTGSNLNIYQVRKWEYVVPLDQFNFGNLDSNYQRSILEYGNTGRNTVS